MTTKALITGSSGGLGIALTHHPQSHNVQTISWNRSLVPIDDKARIRAFKKLRLILFSTSPPPPNPPDAKTKAGLSMLNGHPPLPASLWKWVSDLSSPVQSWSSPMTQ